MDTYASQVYRFPIKGARGTSERSLAIHSEVGVLGDRRYAIRRRASDAPVAWAPKGTFWVGMNKPEIAMECPSQAIEPTYLEELTNWLGGGQVVDTKNTFTMTDTNGPRISILNLATVRKLTAFTDRYIDPRRFRMNVWLENLEPFAELDWVTEYPGTRELRIGGMKFRLDDMCERCKAIEANPETGSYDCNLRSELGDFLQSMGYGGSPHRNSMCVMGVLAIPLESGTISCGDIVTLL